MILLHLPQKVADQHDTSPKKKTWPLGASSFLVGSRWQGFLGVTPGQKAETGNVDLNPGQDEIIPHIQQQGSYKTTAFGTHGLVVGLNMS